PPSSPIPCRFPAPADGYGAEVAFSNPHPSIGSTHSYLWMSSPTRGAATGDEPTSLLLRALPTSVAGGADRALVPRETQPELGCGQQGSAGARHRSLTLTRTRTSQRSVTRGASSRRRRRADSFGTSSQPPRPAALPTSID